MGGANHSGRWDFAGTQAYPARVDLVVLWGWACAAVGTALSVPQVVRLLATRTSAGVSLLLWQLNVANGIGWTAHGLASGHANITVPNALSGLLALLVLALVVHDRRLPVLRVVVLPLLVGLLGVVVVLLAPAGGFGIFAAIPLAIGFGAQTRDLLTAADISGLSPLFVVGALVLQMMWWSWSFIVGEPSILICASIIGVVCAVNVVLLVLRHAGLLRPRVRRPVVAEAA